MWVQKLFFVRMNGVYDVVCALSILHAVPWIRQLHLSMVVPTVSNDLFERTFAYWILTYGCVRCLSNDMGLIVLTYLLEAFCLLNECHIHGTMVATNATITAVCCLGIAALL
jgi:hypothetical protein